MNFERTLQTFQWVHIGCGGTFWAALPFLKVLWSRFRVRNPVFIDPDTVTEANLDRQWLDDRCLGQEKALLASDAFREVRPHEVAETRTLRATSDTTREYANKYSQVLFIVNVDNNAARLAFREGIVTSSHPQNPDRAVAMVVSGCDAEKGQCYTGVWDSEGAIIDWLDFAPDVRDTDQDGQDPACGGQTIRSNALTGVLVGQCISDLETGLRTGHEDPRILNTPSGRWPTYWWSDVEGKGLRTWVTQMATRYSTENERTDANEPQTTTQEQEQTPEQSTDSSVGGTETGPENTSSPEEPSQDGVSVAERSDVEVRDPQPSNPTREEVEAGELGAGATYQVQAEENVHGAPNNSGEVAEVGTAN